MHNADFSASLSSLRRLLPLPAQPVARRVQQAAPGNGRDRQFIELLDACRASGGLAPQSEVAALFVRRNGPHVAALTGWIAAGELICFTWQEQSWLPLFQFQPLDMTPRRSLAPVFAELASVYDPWDTAQWFARRSPWLGQRAPIELLDSDLPAVLQAALADRFFASD